MINPSYVALTIFLATSLSLAAWFASKPLTVDCKRMNQKGKDLMTVEIRGNAVTIKDLVKSEEVTYLTRVTQSGRLKHWENQQIAMAVRLKPSRIGRIFGGGDYHSGSLEFKSLPDADENRYMSLYCYPQEVVE